LNTLQEAIKGAECFFIGLSKADILVPEDILAMAKDPLFLALAIPIQRLLMTLQKRRVMINHGNGASDIPTGE